MRQIRPGLRLDADAVTERFAAALKLPSPGPCVVRAEPRGSSGVGG